jgi:hypothetical protein
MLRDQQPDGPSNGLHIIVLNHLELGVVVMRIRGPTVRLEVLSWVANGVLLCHCRRSRVRTSHASCRGHGGGG